MDYKELAALRARDAGPNATTEPTTVQQELEQVRLQKEKYELEEMKARAAEREQKKEEQRRRAAQIADDIRRTEASERALQKICNHRKGGKDRAGLINGNSTDYAVIHHTYPTGQEWVHCCRCPAVWKPGDTAESHPSGYGYSEAVRWPTDNSPSGSITFSNLTSANA